MHQVSYEPCHAMMLLLACASWLNAVLLQLVQPNVGAWLPHLLLASGETLSKIAD
jgi:hypothetical protein